MYGSHDVSSTASLSLPSTSIVPANHESEEERDLDKESEDEIPVFRRQVKLSKHQTMFGNELANVLKNK
eukprot:Awhi_evm1s3468